MNNESDDKKNKDHDLISAVNNIDANKMKFGALTPLTAVQVVTLLMNSSDAFGGPCY